MSVVPLRSPKDRPPDALDRLVFVASSANPLGGDRLPAADPPPPWAGCHRGTPRCPHTMEPSLEQIHREQVDHWAQPGPPLSPVPSAPYVPPAP